MRSLGSRSTGSDQHEDDTQVLTSEGAGSHEAVQYKPHGSQTTSANVGPQDPVQDSSSEWKAGRGEWMIIAVLAIVYMMVALDATILVPVLTVRALARNGRVMSRSNIT